MGQVGVRHKQETEAGGAGTRHRRGPGTAVTASRQVERRLWSQPGPLAPRLCPAKPDSLAWPRVLPGDLLLWTLDWYPIHSSFSVFPGDQSLSTFPECILLRQ